MNADGTEATLNTDVAKEIYCDLQRAVGRGRHQP